MTSKKPISPLRKPMIENVTMRNFGDKTLKDYIRHVRNFAAFLGRSPDRATAEEQAGGPGRFAGKAIWKVNAGINT